jgi:hypothetical protein
VRRRHRIALTAALLAGAVAGVALLTGVSTSGTGPLSAILRRIGATTASIEHRLRSRVVGEGRESALRWLEPYRSDPARLRRPERVLLGAYDGALPGTLDGVIALEQRLATTLPLVQIYTAWGDKPDQQFPLRLVTAITDIGSIPVVTWEPWLADFESGRHPEIALRPERDRHGLAAVARGEYDFYVNAWAAEAARFGRPLLLRFAHEMNDPYRYPWGPQNNTKEEFVAAWRHVVDRFRTAGADNVFWVWSPHVAYEYWELYYPGDPYVDWVATGVLNFGPVAQWSRWWTFDEIFGTKYPRLAAFQKPIMVAELGSLAVGGDRAAWYRDALAALPVRYPAVRSVLFFNAGEDQTVTYQKVDWRIETDSAVAAAVREAIARWAPRDSTPATPPDSVAAFSSSSNSRRIRHAARSPFPGVRSRDGDSSSPHVR